MDVLSDVSCWAIGGVFPYGRRGVCCTKSDVAAEGMALTLNSGAE